MNARAMARLVQTVAVVRQYGHDARNELLAAFAVIVKCLFQQRDAYIASTDPSPRIPRRGVEQFLLGLPYRRRPVVGLFQSWVQEPLVCGGSDGIEQLPRQLHHAHLG